MPTTANFDYSHRFFDLVNPGDPVDRLNNNLNIWRPGYRFGTAKVYKRGILEAPPDRGVFYWIQRGPAAAAIVEGPDSDEIVLPNCVVQNIATCDLVMLPPGWKAEIRCGDSEINFWFLSIPGTTEDFQYRRGITSIDRCANRSGWCNAGNGDPFSSVRRLVYSSHDPGFTANPTSRSNTGLLIEEHTVLIKQSTSRVPAHYHPANPKPENGQKVNPQLEMYLIGDYRERFYPVDNPESTARLFENPLDENTYSDVSVAPGTAVFIPAGVGHGIFGGQPIVVVSFDRFRFGPSYEVPVGQKPAE